MYTNICFDSVWSGKILSTLAMRSVISGLELHTLVLFNFVCSEK